MRLLVAACMGALAVLCPAAPGVADDPVREPHYAGAFSDASMKEWTVVSGSWELVREEKETRLRCAPAEGIVRLITGDKAWADYAVEVRARAGKWLSETRGDYGLIARYVDPNNYYLFLYDSRPEVRGLIIQKKVQGKLITVASKPFDYRLGQWYTFRGVVAGDALEFYVDGKKLLTATATEFRRGPAGLLTWFADVQYDAFRVSPAAGKAPAAGGQ